MEGEENDLDKAEMDSMIAAQNKKKKKSGGFQSLGLANEVKGLMHYAALECDVNLNYSFIGLPRNHEERLQGPDADTEEGHPSLAGGPGCGGDGPDRLR